MVSENRPEKDFQVQETEEDKVVMMCWANSDKVLAEEPNEETGNQDGRANDDMTKYEEEHVNCTLHMGNQLKISIEEFSWESEDNVSTLNTQEIAQQQLVYITNLEKDS